MIFDDVAPDDSDLEEEDKNKSADASKQRYHTGSIRGLNGEELPQEVQEAIARQIGSSGGFESRSSLPIEIRAMQSMLEFFGQMASYSSDSSLIAAVAEVLDEATSGRVSLVTRRFQAEREIMTGHVAKKFLNFLLDDAPEELKDNELWMQQCMHYFESYIDMNQFFLDRAVYMYRKTCAELKQEPDEQLIELGRYTSRNFIRQIAFRNPPADDYHEDIYG